MEAVANRRWATQAAPGAAPGLVLAAGALGLLAGIVFYVQLPPVLAAPASPAAYPGVAAAALAAGPAAMARAGGFAFLGDALLLAASLVFLPRARGAAALGWALLVVSVVGAMVMDSLMAVGLCALVPFKTWFDFLFAAGNATGGLGMVAIAWADERTERLLPRWVDRAGIAGGAVAVAGATAYLLGAPVPGPAHGLPLVAFCLLFTAFGVQLARRGEA